MRFLCSFCSEEILNKVIFDCHVVSHVRSIPSLVPEDRVRRRVSVMLGHLHRPLNLRISSRFWELCLIRLFFVHDSHRENDFRFGPGGMFNSKVAQHGSHQTCGTCWFRSSSRCTCVCVKLLVYETLIY